MTPEHEEEVFHLVVHGLEQGLAVVIVVDQHPELLVRETCGHHHDHLSRQLQLGGPKLRWQRPRVGQGLARDHLASEHRAVR